MRLIVYVSAVLFLASCSMAPQQQTETTEPATASSKTQMPTGKLYQIDTSLSELRIVTYPQGRFGHSHVIGGEVVHGQITLPDNYHKVWFDISLNVADFEVDNPAWRQDEGFEPEMSQQAIMGTRENMLSEKLLNADKYPEIRIQSTQASGPLWQPDIKASITLAGITREITLPVSVHSAENRLEVTGQLQILQTEFGIKPFTALGGILGVADKVLIRFRIHASAQ